MKLPPNSSFYQQIFSLVEKSKKNLIINTIAYTTLNCFTAIYSILQFASGNKIFRDFFTVSLLSSEIPNVCKNPSITGHFAV